MMTMTMIMIIVSLVGSISQERCRAEKALLQFMLVETLMESIPQIFIQCQALVLDVLERYLTTQDDLRHLTSVPSYTSTTMNSLHIRLVSLVFSTVCATLTMAKVYVGSCRVWTQIVCVIRFMSELLLRVFTWHLMFILEPFTARTILAASLFLCACDSFAITILFQDTTLYIMHHRDQDLEMMMAMEPGDGDGNPQQQDRLSSSSSCCLSPRLFLKALILLVLRYVLVFDPAMALKHYARQVPGDGANNNGNEGKIGSTTTSSGYGFIKIRVMFWMALRLMEFAIIGWSYDRETPSLTHL